MKELKPCPFCSGEPTTLRREIIQYFAPDNEEHIVWCRKCYAELKRETEYLAIMAWNSRKQ